MKLEKHGSTWVMKTLFYEINLNVLMHQYGAV